MVSRLSRRGFLAVAGTAVAAGCVGGANGGNAGGEGSSPTAAPTDPPGDTTSTTAADSGGGAGAAPPTAAYTLPLPMSGDDLRGEARSGGPPKDGIPSIDEPKFVSPDEADGFLDAGDIVFGVVRGESVKAYPQKVLVWHEIVNDVLDGDRVSVTYCPLTGTVQGFDRGSTTFGVSGRLLNNNLIMYDRATENWWPQVLATAIPGPWNSSLSGKSLSEFRVVWTTWERWLDLQPDTVVLSTQTGYGRNYRRDPYGSYNPKGGYYENSGTLFPRLHEDDRFHPKRVVMGVRSAEGAAAALKDRVREVGLVEGAVGDRPVLWAYEPDLDTAYAYWNPDGLGFEYRDGTVVGPDGEHAAGALPLERALTFDAMWFAWSGFYPGTSVHE